MPIRRLSALIALASASAFLALEACACRADGAKRIDPSIFGVMASGGGAARPEAVDAVADLHAGWVRVNWDFDRVTPDFTRFLEKGIGVVVCMSNKDPENAREGKHGTRKEWTHASFPYKDEGRYRERIVGVLKAALPHLRKGRQVWVQCENEVGDASMNPRSRYWRGTMEDYAVQLKAFSGAVRGFCAESKVKIPVVLASFASEKLDHLMEGGEKEPNAADGKEERRRAYALKTTKAMLDLADHYDAVDLHLYGSPKDIPAKVKAVRDLMPKGHPFVWISTECGGPDYRSPDTAVRWDKDREGFEKLQARQVKERFTAAAECGASICLWFSLFDLKRESDAFAHLGLLDQGEDPPARKPAYQAFKSFLEGLR